MKRWRLQDNFKYKKNLSLLSTVNMWPPSGSLSCFWTPCSFLFFFWADFLLWNCQSCAKTHLRFSAMAAICWTKLLIKRPLAFQGQVSYQARSFFLFQGKFVQRKGCPESCCHFGVLSVVHIGWSYTCLPPVDDLKKIIVVSWYTKWRYHEHALNICYF